MKEIFSCKRTLTEINFKISCCNLKKIRGLGAKLCVVFPLL